MFPTTLIAIGMAFVQKMGNCLLPPPKFSTNDIIGIEPLVCVCVVPDPRLQPRATQPVLLLVKARQAGVWTDRKTDMGNEITQNSLNASGMKCALHLHFCADVSTGIRKMRNIDMRAA